MRWALGIATTLAGCGFAGSGPQDGGGDAAGDAPRDGGIDPMMPCPALAPAPAGSTLVRDAEALRAAIDAATPGATIVLASGTYLVGAGPGLALDVPGVTLRSQSGAATDVVLDGQYVAGRLLTVSASDVTIAGITVAHAANIGIAVEATTAPITGVTIYGVHLLDNPGMAIAARSAVGPATGPYPDAGEIACSHFEHRPGAPDPCGIGGMAIDAVGVRDWIVRHNRFDRMACTTASRRAIWFRDGSRDTQILANVFVGSAQSIALGGAPLAGGRTYADPPPAACAGVPEHWGGVVCNNAIAGYGLPPLLGSPDFGEGVALWTACDPWVLHNTIASPSVAETAASIDYRYPGSFVHLVNNLALVPPTGRDGATADPAYAASNATYASAADFVNAPGGDLRLSPTAAPPAGVPIGDLGLCTLDGRGAARDLAAPDPGAFER